MPYTIKTPSPLRGPLRETRLGNQGTIADVVDPQARITFCSAVPLLLERDKRVRQKKPPATPAVRIVITVSSTLFRIQCLFDPVLQVHQVRPGGGIAGARSIPDLCFQRTQLVPNL